MRGTPKEGAYGKAIDGIIPAYAGNTFHQVLGGEFVGDHPRVCGEHPYRIIPIPEDMGSSPRMRGTLGFRGGGIVHRGIIPAYAGNTCDHAAFG